jgi:hypothetical protein
MENSKLSMMTWYSAVFLLSDTKKRCSSKGIQRQLDLKTYEPVWAMGQRNDRYTVEEITEMDEGYFTIDASEQSQKAGRGSNAKSNIIVLAESTVLKNLDTVKVESHRSYFKDKVLEDHQAQGTEDTVKKSIDNGQTIILADKSTSYINIADDVGLHSSEKSNEQTARETLKCAYITISNAKRNFMGTYYKIKKKYLQRYLIEFVYRRNRKYFQERLFNRLVIASITDTG